MRVSKLTGQRLSQHFLKHNHHVSRVDNVFGDRNPVCSCVGMEAYQS
jgi:hypothetical protein